MQRTIVLGYDGSPCANEALAAALAHATAHQAALAVVYGHELPLGMRDEAPVGSDDAHQVDAFKQRVGAEIEEVLGEARRLVEAADVEVGTHVVWREPAAALLETADATSALMIVVGTHGEGALGRMLHGSVAHSLVHHSPVPVLVVPRRT